MRTTTFALVIGLAYLAAGVLGFIPAALRPPPADAPPTTFTVLYGYLIGLFPVNVVHSLVHLAIGAWGVLAARGTVAAQVFSRSLAIIYGLLAVMGLVPGMNTLFGMLPLYGHDIWLHAGTAAIAAYFGWREVKKERRSLPDRRQRMLPVARERRIGLADRRHATYGSA